MAVRVDCPRCQHPLSVPRKLTGGYVNCPRCAARFWMPKGGVLENAPNEAASPASPPVAGQGPSAAIRSAPMLLVPRPAPGDGVTPDSPSPPVPSFGKAPGDLPVTPPPVIAQPAPQKVAKLVVPDAAQSSLTIAADGQLPQLQLQEGEKKDGAAKLRTVPPLLLLGMLAASIALSLVLVLLDVDSASNDSAQRAAALQFIEENHFGKTPRGELAPYQVLLRQARQAGSRGDYRTERRCYRKVLELLRAEKPSSARTKQVAGLEPGLTGSRQRDRELEQQITILLRTRGSKD